MGRVSKIYWTPRWIKLNSRWIDLPRENTVSCSLTGSASPLTTDSAPIIFHLTLSKSTQGMLLPVPLMGKVSWTRRCNGTEIAKVAVSTHRVTPVVQAATMLVNRVRGALILVLCTSRRRMSSCWLTVSLPMNRLVVHKTALCGLSLLQIRSIPVDT
jgi:mRNA-degrading endonuclease toxin of MazEF toxin-antitoxin module